MPVRGQAGSSPCVRLCGAGATDQPPVERAHGWQAISESERDERMPRTGRGSLSPAVTDVHGSSVLGKREQNQSAGWTEVD